MPPEPQLHKGALVLGGAHGSLEIVRSLGRRGIQVWLLTDDNPLARLSRYVTRSLHWPGPRDDGAVDFLRDLAARFRLEGWVLFAGADADVRFIAQNHSALGAIFRLTTPRWDVIRWAYDKRLMNTRAAELGMALPRSYYPRHRAELAELEIRYPVVIKPTVCEGRDAFVAAKAWRADDQRTLAAYYDEAEALVGSGSIMIQELIPGNGHAQVSYAAVWDRGQPVASLVARRRRQYPIDFGFTSTFVETITCDEVEDAACRFLRSLDYSGLVEMEFKFDVRDAAYKILDVNARSWTWIALGAASGLDFAAVQWRVANGEPVEPHSARAGATWRYLSRDLIAAGQEMFYGVLSPIEYLTSLRPSSAAAVFAWDDPVPAVLDLPVVTGRVIKRRLFRRRNRPSVSTLQSAKLRL
jgi:D-aspartate ligase